MLARRVASLAPLFLFACAGGPPSAPEDPFIGEREEALRPEECPARLSIELTAIDVPTDERLADDLTRHERAKGSAEPSAIASAKAQLDDVRPSLVSARATSSVALLGDSSQACSYRAIDARTEAPTDHLVRVVRTRRANGGEASLALRLRAPVDGRADAALWYEVPLESLGARSIVVDTRRTPTIFAQAAEATVIIGTFEATARAVP